MTARRISTGHTKGRRRALAVFGVLLLVFGLAGFGVLLWSQITRHDIDLAEDLCVEGERPLEHVIILVDQSNEFTPTELGVLRETIESSARNVSQRGRLTLLYMNEQEPHRPRQIFSKCRPPTEGEANPLWVDPEDVQEDWESTFGAPLDAALQELTTPRSQDSSPIMESMRGLEWRSDFGSAQPNRRLIVVSDFLQHSGRFSMYPPEGSRSFHTLLADVDLPLLRPNLSNVAVRLIVLRSERALPLQDAAFEELWPAFVRESGAELEESNLSQDGR